VLVFTQDTKRLYEHFRKDPVLFAYHLGDLDNSYFPHCQWAATYGRSPRIDDVVLLYTGLSTPTVLAFGLSARFADLVSDYLDLLPERFYGHFLPQHRELFLSKYCERPLGTHLNMRLGNYRPSRKPVDGSIELLGEAHLPELKALYDRAYPDNYFEAHMLATGKYFGVEADHKLVAVAGVHVCSDEYDIAVLGNIATDPDYRGRGLGTAVTSHLAGILGEEGKQVVLNVKADNAPAISCYYRLGFEQAWEYEEALFELKVVAGT